jgi:hypothetical protein
MRVRPVLPEGIMHVWPLVQERLQRALNHGVGESTLADWHKSLVNGASQLWVIDHEEAIVGAVLTQILTYVRHKTLQIVLFEATKPLHADLEKFAMDNQCVAVEQWGRRGWARVLPTQVPGYEEAYVVMRKKLPTNLEATASPTRSIP